jgi:hypothetical protein
MKIPIYITAEPSAQFVQSIMEICASHEIDVDSIKEAIEPKILRGNTSAHSEHDPIARTRILSEARQALVWLLENLMMLEEFPPGFAKDIQQTLHGIATEWKFVLFFDVDFDIEYEVKSDNEQLASKLATLLTLN